MAKTKKVGNTKAAVLKVLQGERKRLEQGVNALKRTAEENRKASGAQMASDVEEAELEHDERVEEIEAQLEDDLERLQQQLDALHDLIEAY